MERLKRSRISFIQNYFFIFLLSIFLLFLQSWQLEEYIKVTLTFASFAAILLLSIEPELSRIYRYYMLEEKNVIMEEGIFSKKRISIPYDQIADISISKSILGRILKFGDLSITGVKNEIEMKGIRKPDEIYEKIKARIEKSK